MSKPLAMETEYQLERKLIAIDIGELLSMNIPPREMLLAPVLPRQGLVMAYSKQGLGKTHLALNIAYAVAGGGQFLRWKAPKPARVLLVDGEMPLVALQERLTSIVAGAEKQPPETSYFQIIAADHQEEGIPWHMANCSIDGICFVVNKLIQAAVPVVVTFLAQSQNGICPILLMLKDGQATLGFRTASTGCT
jgi:hypothetical protein